jgi:hypothetical protein
MNSKEQMIYHFNHKSTNNPVAINCGWVVFKFIKLVSTKVRLITLDIEVYDVSTDFKKETYHLYRKALQIKFLGLVWSNLFTYYNMQLIITKTLDNVSKLSRTTECD